MKEEKRATREKQKLDKKFLKLRRNETNTTTKKELIFTMFFLKYTAENNSA